MTKQIFAALGLLALCAGSAHAMDVPGDPEAGRQLVMNSCTACHAPTGTKAATDGAPPLSFIARDTKADPLSIHAWLMDPHPPMPGIMLSRKQVSDVIAYFSTFPAE